MEKTLPRRDEVPQADRWAVETVFPSEEAFDDAYARASARIALLADLSGTLGASGGQLLAALEARQSVEVEVSRVRLYAMMQSSGDETNQANGARREHAGALVTRFEATVAYVESEIVAIPPATLERFLSEEPGLALFRHYLDGVVRLRDHVRSAEVESLLARAGDALASSWQTHEALENADLRFATITDEDGSDVELAQGNGSCPHLMMLVGSLSAIYSEAASHTRLRRPVSPLARLWGVLPADCRATRSSPERRQRPHHQMWA